MVKARTIETKRLLLRAFEQSDKDALMQGLMSDPDVMATLPEQPATPEEQSLTAQKYIDECTGGWNVHGYGAWAVTIGSPELGPAGTLVGFCGFFESKLPDDGPELGYGLAKTHWGKGIATESAFACMDYLFAKGDVDSVYAVCDPDYRPTRNVLEKLGMKHARDVDLYDSVAKGYGLLPLHTVSRSGYLAYRAA